MYRPTMCPSSGETTVFMRHLVLVILYGWLSGMQRGSVQFHSTLHTRQSSTQNNKYQVSHKHSYSSWWWAHSRPKHVEIDKYTKNKLCTELPLFTRLHKYFKCSSWQYSYAFFISNFRRVLNVVCFLFGNSPASEVYMPTFRNALFHLHRQVGVCRMNWVRGMLVCHRGRDLAWK
jgi:hypothetical protein